MERSEDHREDDAKGVMEPRKRVVSQVRVLIERSRYPRVG
jgi:hypothetical protein